MSKLPKPKFNLRKPKSTNETLISLVFRYKGKRLVYSTGHSVHPSDWDFDAQRPIQQQGRPELFAIKRALDELCDLCMDIFIEADYGQISTKEFKAKLDERTGKVDEPKKAAEKKKKPNFLEFLDIELQEMKDRGMLNSSWKAFNRQANIIKAFAREEGIFDYDDVDWNFRLRMIDWLSDRNHMLAYGNKTLGILRQFLERARRKKLHNNTSYQGAGWMVSKKRATSQKTILTPNELQILADLQLDGSKAKVRDLFLIGAGTGQRFSDYSRYKPDHFYKTINNITILSIIAQKTAIPAKIPLNIFPWLIPVLERNEYRSPELSMQTFNEEIKEICKAVDFSENILVVEQYMGRKPRVEKKYIPKYKLVSSHTCRRSFATNLYRMGYRIAQIMPMTGHTTEYQFRQYVGIDGEQNAEEVALSIMQRQQNRDEDNNLWVVNS
jgi:integrase